MTPVAPKADEGTDIWENVSLMMGAHAKSEWRDRLQFRRNPLQPGEIGTVADLGPEAARFITLPIKGPLLHVEIFIRRQGHLRVFASEKERFPNANNHEYSFDFKRQQHSLVIRPKNALMTSEGSLRLALYSSESTSLIYAYTHHPETSSSQLPTAKQLRYKL